MASLVWREVAFGLTFGELEDVDHEKAIFEEDAVVVGGSAVG